MGFSCNSPARRIVCILVTALAAAMLCGCQALIRNAARPTIQNIIDTTMMQDDPETVRMGGPSYLLLIESFARSAEDDDEMQSAASQIYNAYASAFLVGREPERARRMSRKSLDYAVHSMSLRNDTFAELHAKPFEEFEAIIPTLGEDDKAPLFVLISAWATYVQAHRDDWNAVADLPKIRALNERLLELDETYQHGSPHLLMGVLETLLPPMMGGKPEVAREHFERALEISGRRFLQAQVLYAKQYARMVYNKELHDRLLKEVLEAPADAIPELTLMNTLAKEEAERLLAESSDYF